MKKFKLKEETIVTYDDIGTITLSTGNIHVTEITIMLEKSSKVSNLLKNRKIELLESDESYDDIKQLFNYGFLDFEISVDKKAMLVTNKISNTQIELLKINNYDILFIEDILSEKELQNVVENKLNFEKIQKTFSKYDFISLINPTNNIHISRIFNKIFVYLDRPYNLLLIDNCNIFISNVVPGVSGCYGCFEKKILSKKQNQGIKYTENIGYDKNAFLVALGLNNTNLSSLSLYGISSLTGNFLHFYLPLFEYDFDFNRRTILCTDCRKYNELQFEEQNIRSINLLKEIRRENENLDK